MLKAVPGTNDVFAQAREYPFREPVFRYIIRTAEEVLRGAGAQMIHTPVFEYLEVFQKGVGLTSDIVVKRRCSCWKTAGGGCWRCAPNPPRPSCGPTTSTA